LIFVGCSAGFPSSISRNQIGDAKMTEVQAALKHKPTPDEVLQAQISAGIIAGAPAESIVEEPPLSEYGEVEACGVMDRCVSEKGEDMCLLCQETFNLTTKSPLLIPCLHNICRKCAEEQQSESELEVGFTCFDCDRPTEATTADLQPDYTTLGWLKATKPTVPMCQLCEQFGDEEPATKYCGDCEQTKFFCGECFKRHKKQSRKGHKSIPIEEYLGGGGGAASQPTTLMCHLHPTQGLKLFCRTCERLICVKCAAFEHRGHDFVPLQEELALSKCTVMTAAIPTTNKLTTVEENIARFQGMVEALNEHEQQGITTIEDTFKTIHQTTVQRKTNLTAEFKTEVKRNRDVVQGCITDLENHRDHTKFGLTMVKQALDTATPTQLLGIRRLLADGLKKLEEHKITTKLDCFASVRVDSAATYDTLLQMLSTLGTVVGE
jgi:hypothetical protein